MQAGDAFCQLQVRNLLDSVLQVRTDYVLQVRNLLTMYYKLELTLYYYCLWYDKLWGPSQRVVTLFFNLFRQLSIYFLYFNCSVWWAMQCSWWADPLVFNLLTYFSIYSFNDLFIFCITTAVSGGRCSAVSGQTH